MPSTPRLKVLSVSSDAKTRKGEKYEPAIELLCEQGYLFKLKGKPRRYAVNPLAQV